MDKKSTERKMIAIPALFHDWLAARSKINHRSLSGELLAIMELLNSQEENSAVDSSPAPKSRKVKKS